MQKRLSLFKLAAVQSSIGEHSIFLRFDAAKFCRCQWEMIFVVFSSIIGWMIVKTLRCAEAQIKKSEHAKILCKWRNQLSIFFLLFLAHPQRKFTFKFQAVEKRHRTNGEKAKTKKNVQSIWKLHSERKSIEIPFMMNWLIAHEMRRDRIANRHVWH